MHKESTKSLMMAKEKQETILSILGKGDKILFSFSFFSFLVLFLFLLVVITFARFEVFVNHFFISLW